MSAAPGPATAVAEVVVHRAPSSPMVGAAEVGERFGFTPSRLQDVWR